MFYGPRAFFWYSFILIRGANNSGVALKSVAHFIQVELDQDKRRLWEKKKKKTEQY